MNRTRMALAMAALLIAALALWFGLRRPAPPPPAPAPAVGDVLALRVEGTRAIEGEGELELRWAPIAGADHYQVWFFDSDLHDLASPPPVREPSLILRHDALPTGLTSNTMILWRVSAFQRGQPVAQSPMIPARLP